mmetsp:Transcript_11590/g.32834  ORF Transcript_11590/g.32834 Transcript_11590/m.32834 type:complete len:253 (+) Transcript_11590:789-1547(+)
MVAPKDDHGAVAHGGVDLRVEHVNEAANLVVHESGGGVVAAVAVRHRIVRVVRVVLELAVVERDERGPIGEVVPQGLVLGIFFPQVRRGLEHVVWDLAVDVIKGLGCDPGHVRLGKANPEEEWLARLGQAAKTLLRIHADAKIDVFLRVLVVKLKEKVSELVVVADLAARPAHARAGVAKFERVVEVVVGLHDLVEGASRFARAAALVDVVLEVTSVDELAGDLRPVAVLVAQILGYCGEVPVLCAVLLAEA